MARTPYEQHDGQAGTVSGDTAKTIQAGSDDILALPVDGDFIKNAELGREGQDLIIEGPDGTVIIIKDYFNAEPAPLLQSETGEALTPDLVESFVQSPAQYAQKGSLDDESPVGNVKEVSGDATVTRIDGSVEKITIGTPIYEGDIIETNADGAVGITFIDDSTFAVSQNAKLAIDEYVFDPSSETGSSDFSILRGLFVFTSGLIGRDDPDDVAIDTPMGTIGIRGTVIAGNVDTGEITVLEGAIVLRTFDGTEMTLAEQYETARFDAANGDIVYVGTTSAATFSETFSAVRAVAPTLFTALDAAPAEAKPVSTQDETAPAEAQPVEQEQPAQDAAPAEQPAMEAVPNAPQQPATEQQTAPQTGQQPTAPAQESQMLPPADPFFNDPAQTGFTNTGFTTQTVTPPLAPATMTAPVTGGTAYVPPPTAPVTNTTTVTTVTPPPPPPASGGGTTPPPNLSHIHLGAIIGGSTADGFFISGATGQKLGDYVAAAGDFNSDGLADFFVAESKTSTGKVFIYDGAGTVLGGGITSPGTPTTNLTAASIGDMNMDGQADYIVGAPDGAAGFRGAAQLFVTSQGPVSFTGQTDNTTGATNIDDGDMLGESLNGIGDINGDGYSDMIISAPGRDFGSTLDDMGSAYIIKGAATIASPVNLNSIASWGFKVDGTNSGDMYGSETAGAGDLNNDGFSDFAVSKPGAGSVDIFFGNLVQANILSSKKTIVGINVDPTEKEIPLFNMGDMNGDGISDIAVASTNGPGAVHIFSGSALAAGGATISTTSAMQTITPGPTGFEIVGGGAAGDFNGDGYDDGVLAFRNGTQLEVFVYYGSPAAGNINMGTLIDPSKAFRMSLDLGAYNVANPAEFDVNVANPGDLNGDGFDDIVLGMAGLNGGNGGVFVIDGRNDAAIGSDGRPVHIAGQTTALNNVIANANGQHLVGNNANNVLDQNGMLDVSFRGGAGNDVIRIGTTDFLGIDGGSGLDRLELHFAASIDLSVVGTEALTGIEEIAMMGTNQTLKLGIDDIFRLLQQSDNDGLRISANGDTTNRLLIGNNGNAAMFAGPIANAASLQTELGDINGMTVNHTVSGGYDQFSFGGYTLEIQSVLLDGTNPSQIV